MVGIGDEDFSQMEFLDGDENELISTSGEKAERDIVQFLPFLKFKYNAHILRRTLLEELPEQVLTFYHSK